jgi:hypothetical protein
MALTTYLINQASDHLSEKHIQLWLLLFRKLPKYQEYAFVYSDTLEERLAAAEGTVKARMLNALMKEIDDLGVGEVHVGGDQRTIGAGAGDREGTHWSQTIERMTLIEEGLDVLYDNISTLIIPPTGTNPNGETFSAGGFSAATGQRSVNMYCPVCHIQIIHRNGRGFCRCL